MRANPIIIFISTTVTLLGEQHTHNIHKYFQSQSAHTLRTVLFRGS